MDPRNAQIIKMLRTPKTYRELSDEIGVGYHTVRQYVKSLIDLGFIEEMPWPKSGTNQKQFRSNVSNPDKEFTVEGCSIFELGKRKKTASGLVESDLEAFHFLVDLPFVALSAPMLEYMAHKYPSEYFVASSPSSALVAEKLAELHEQLVAFTKLVEQLIAVGTWDPTHPEFNKTLFHTEPEKINWENVKKAYVRLQEIDNERGW